MYSNINYQLKYTRNSTSSRLLSIFTDSIFVKTTHEVGHSIETLPCVKNNNQYRVQIFANSSKYWVASKMSMFVVPIKCAQILSCIIKDTLNKEVESKLFVHLFDFLGMNIEIEFIIFIFSLILLSYDKLVQLLIDLFSLQLKHLFCVVKIFTIKCLKHFS